MYNNPYNYQIIVIGNYPPQHSDYLSGQPIASNIYHQPQPTSQQKQQYYQLGSQYIAQSQISHTSKPQSVQQGFDSFNQKYAKQPFNPHQGQQQQQPSYTNQTAPQHYSHIHNTHTPSEYYQPQKEQQHYQNTAIPFAQEAQYHQMQSQQDNYWPQSGPYSHETQTQQYQYANQQTNEKIQPQQAEKKRDLDQKINYYEKKSPQKLKKIQQVSNPLQKQEFRKTQPKVKENQLQQLTLHYQNGYTYRGQGYEPDIREGDGTLTDQNENPVYTGQWKDNQYHGKGKLINVGQEQNVYPFDYQDLNEIENGWSQYEGDFSQGQMHGEGLLQLTNEEFFKGLFLNGKIHGKGKFTTLNGQSLTGFWNKGVLTSVYC